MGVLLDSYKRVNKKRCTMCGCDMEPDHINDLCECCLDDLAEIDQEGES